MGSQSSKGSSHQHNHGSGLDRFLSGGGACMCAQGEGHFMPVRIAALLEQPRLSAKDEVEYTWDRQAHSHNIHIHPDDPHTIHRNPVAQSTDCARGRLGVSSGIHAWQIQWKRKEYGSHAVVGVATADCPLHRPGYGNLIGSNAESWGWDLISRQAIHNLSMHRVSGPNNQNRGTPLTPFPWRQERDEQLHTLTNRRSTNQTRTTTEQTSTPSGDTSTSMDATSSGGPSPPFNILRLGGEQRSLGSVNVRYPSGDLLMDGMEEPLGMGTPTLIMIVDMNEGTLSFVVNGRYLGVCHRGLKGRTLYPVVNCVWGNCEIQLRYINGLSLVPPSLLLLSRHAILEHLSRVVEHNRLLSPGTTPPSLPPFLAPSPSALVPGSLSCHNGNSTSSFSGVIRHSGMGYSPTTGPSTSTGRDSNDNMSCRVMDVREEKNMRIQRLPLPKCFRDELLNYWY